MSDETTTNQEAVVSNYMYQEDPSTKQRFVVVDDGYKVVEELITREGSLLKGFTWHRQEFDSASKAIEILGDETVRDIINDRVAQLTYIRAVGGVKGQLTGDDEAAWKVQLENLFPTDKNIFSVEQAMQFKPGERELSPKRLSKLIATAFSNYRKLLQSGKREEAKKELDLFNSLMEKMASAAEAAEKQYAAAEASAEA